MKVRNIWQIFAPILIIIVSIASKASYLQTIASVTGVIYVLLIGRENKLAYIFGVINVLLYATESLGQGLIGSSILNILTSIPILIYGYIYWNKNQGKKEGNIKRLTEKDKYAILICAIIAMTIYYLIIIKFTPVYKAVIDTVVAIISIIGNILMSKKYYEQWWCWVIVNTSNVSFWITICVNEPQNLSLLIMWLIYLCNTLVGMSTWKSKMSTLHIDKDVI